MLRRSYRKIKKRLRGVHARSALAMERDFDHNDCKTVVTLLIVANSWVVNYFRYVNYFQLVQFLYKRHAMIQLKPSVVMRLKTAGLS